MREAFKSSDWKELSLRSRSEDKRGHDPENLAAINPGVGLKRAEKFLLTAAIGLLCLCFISGGDSAQANFGMMASQLLAIPVLVIAVIHYTGRERIAADRWAIFAVLVIVLVPLLQLLPLPALVWNLPTFRAQLLQDLQSAGVAGVDQRWSLSPGSTERNLYFLLPGLALFFSMLALGRSAWRMMLMVVILLGVANLALAFAQVIAGQDSFLNPYPDFAPALAGIFANRNHQADMLAIGLMLVGVLLLNAWKRRDESNRSGTKIGMLASTALIFVLSLPLIGSRAGVIVAMVMLMGVLLSSGLPTLREFRKSRLLQIGSALALLVFVVGLYAALAWMQSDASDSVLAGSRSRIAEETVQIGHQHAPLGAGAGTFIPAFKQGASDDFLMSEYVNNAHNEYAQWWLEAGVLGVLAALLVLIAITKALISLLRQRCESRTRMCGIAALMGIGVIILHSTVDYPLRTQALMAVFAVLAGIAIGAAAKGSSAASTDVRRVARD